MTQCCLVYETGYLVHGTVSGVWYSVWCMVQCMVYGAVCGARHSVWCMIQ